MPIIAKVRKLPMNNIELLREKRANLWNQAQTFLNSKQTPDGMISTEDAATYDRMETELIEIGNQIERLERSRNMERQFANTTSPIIHTPTSHKIGSDSYSVAFWNAIRGRGISNALSEGTDTSGGYLVPDEFSKTLVQALSEQNIFRQIARIERTSSDTLKIPIAEGGASVNWISENATIPETDVTFNQIVLKPYKLGCLIRASTELMEDSVFDLQRHIADQFAKEIGKAEEEAFCIGVGDDRPSGIFSGGADVGVTTSSKTAITFDDVIDLLHSVKPPYRGKSVFVTNDSTIRELRKIKDGNGQYIWQPAVKDGLPDTILARPVYICPYVPVIEAGASVMAFGDFSHYWIADRRNFRFKVLNERFAENDQVGFHATARVDGKLVLREAVKLLAMAE
jgi:HK97 family phage major capsid protein